MNVKGGEGVQGIEGDLYGSLGLPSLNSPGASCPLLFFALETSSYDLTSFSFYCIFQVQLLALIHWETVKLADHPLALVAPNNGLFHWASCALIRTNQPDRLWF